MKLSSSSDYEVVFNIELQNRTIESKPTYNKGSHPTTISNIQEDRITDSESIFTIRKKK